MTLSQLFYSVIDCLQVLTCLKQTFIMINHLIWLIFIRNSQTALILLPKSLKKKSLQVRSFATERFVCWGKEFKQNMIFLEKDKSQITKADFLAYYKLSEAEADVQSKVYQNSEEYLKACKAGLEGYFKNGLLQHITVYNKYDKSYSEYKDPLPYKLNFQMKGSDIVAKFGEPDKKSGGNQLPICIHYERLGLEFTFATNDWNKQDCAIQFICIFQKDPSDLYKKCGICQKQTTLSCSKCKLIFYCS